MPDSGVQTRRLPKSLEAYHSRLQELLTAPTMDTPSDYAHNIESADPQIIGGLKVSGLGTLDGYKFNLEDGGWLLIQFSGTEPIVRVYIETTHKDEVQPILQDGLKIVGIG